MSWNNPSQDEAADEYYASRSRYNNAANQRYAALREADNCRSERSSAQSACDSCRNDKLNFEKRVEDIHIIINAIQGSGGLLASLIGGTVPEILTGFNAVAGTTDTSYSESIRCTDITPASIYDSYKNLGVEGDPNVSGALDKYRAEVARLEQAIRDLEAQIAALSAQIDTLTSRISSLNADAAELQSIMNSSAYEMDHYRSYM